VSIPCARYVRGLGSCLIDVVSSNDPLSKDNESCITGLTIKFSVMQSKRVFKLGLPKQVNAFLLLQVGFGLDEVGVPNWVGFE